MSQEQANSSTELETQTDDTGAAPVEGTPATGDEGGAPAWTPDFKFKVMDKDYEIEDYLRGAIKDEESLKKTKELYEKAYGLDHVKPKYENLKKQHEALEPQFQAVSKDLQILGHYLKNKDLGSVFQMLQLPEELIFQYVNERLDYIEATPEKRARLDEDARIRAEHAKLQFENGDFRQQSEVQQAQKIESDFSALMTAPHISQIAQNFDARAGKANAFRDAALQHGITQSRLAGRNLPVDEVIQSFITTFGLNAMQASQPAVQQQVPAGSGQSPERKATLPKVDGTGAAPVKAKVKTLDDLRKKAEEMASQNK